MQEIIGTITHSLPLLLKGLVFTLVMAISALAIGLIIGLLLGVARFYGGRVLNAIAIAYCRIFRSIPVIVMVTMLYLAFASLLNLTPFVSVILGLALHDGAYQAEIIRGAINAISKGEIAAANALGMSSGKVFFNIILPQMAINAIPGWQNQVALTLKETSVGFVIGAAEMMRQATYITAVNREYLLIYLLTGFIYLILTLTSNVAIGRLNIRYHGA